MTRSPIIPPTPQATDYEAEGAAPPIAETTEPIELFQAWLAEARISELNDSNAMALATVDEQGMPDVRMVLLKDIRDGALTFFTHETSAKGLQLATVQKAAVCFHWKSMRRQIRVRGSVSRLPDAEADAYFHSRARLSQLGAVASDQSQPLASRDELVARLQEAEAAYPEETQVDRPAHWGGYLITPASIEFWQDQPYRLHDRVRFERAGGEWTTTRLYP